MPLGAYVASWPAWKKFEKECADFFGGTRRVRIDYAQRIGDIDHPHYSIEAKYGEQCPGYAMTKGKCLLFTKESYFEIRHSDTMKIVDKRITETDNSEMEIFYTSIPCKFLEEAMKQACKYAPSLQPLVCLKKPRMKGFVVASGGKICR